MKVLLVNKFFYRRGGDCTYTFALADLLRSHGHDVAFFSMHHPKNEPCEQSQFFVDHIDYEELNRNKGPITVARVLARSFYSRQARRRLGDLLDTIRPDVAHLQNIHTHLTPSILDTFRERGIPVVWTLHDYKLLCPEDSFLSNGSVCEACKGKRFYQCTLKRCKKHSLLASLAASLEAYVHQVLHLSRKVTTLVSPSRFLREKFIEFGWDESQVVFLRNFLPSMPEPCRAGDGYGIYLGTHQPWKGIPTLLRALGEACPERPFHILGDGPQRRELKSLARSMGLGEVTFPGFLTGEALANEIIGADYAVVPSEWYENCPYSVMELMAHGKPVVASNIGGLPELVQGGQTGLLFEAGHETQLAQRIELLAGDGALRRELGRKARAYAESEFDASRYYEQIMRVYQNGLGI